MQPLSAQPKLSAPIGARLTSLTDGKRRLQGYPVISDWPELPQAVAVHLHVGTNRTMFRVPVKMMRNCGLQPERGVQVAVYQDRLLIWSGEHGGPYRHDDETKQFLLYGVGVATGLRQENLAIIEGPGYLVLTSGEQALKLARTAPVVEHAPWVRVTNEKVALRSEPFEPTGVAILGWKDVKVGHTTTRCESSIAKVAGRLWGVAGFQCGDSIRFVRYPNATVVEKCTPEKRHSILGQTRKNGGPSHYFGTALFDIHHTDTVRVIASQGRLIVTKPDSDVGQLCVAQLGNQAPTYFGAIKSKPAEWRGPLEASALAGAVTWKDYRVTNNRVTVFGRILTAGGFDKNSPVRVKRYANAVAIEACDTQNMEFRLGSPGKALPYRNLGLAATVLSGSGFVRAFITKNRVILTALGSDLSALAKNITPWPADPEEIAELLAQTAETTEPLTTEVGRYTIPSGKRLQIQGKWLDSLGFKPGTKFKVTARAGKVFLELDGEGSGQVTEHSPGIPKLYVPAKSLAGLTAAKVRVLGHKGVLQLVPLAA